MKHNYFSSASSSGSPLPANEVTSPQNRVHGTSLSSSAVNAATEWFLKAYQRTQEQVQSFMFTKAINNIKASKHLWCRKLGSNSVISAFQVN